MRMSVTITPKFLPMNAKQGATMKSLDDKKREILEKFFGKDYLRDIHTGKSIDMTDEINQALSQLNTLDKSSQLTKKEFHHILSEFPPSIAEDSGQPEWTQGEIDKVWDFITGKNKFIPYNRWERKPRIDEGKLREILKSYKLSPRFVGEDIAFKYWDGKKVKEGLTLHAVRELAHAIAQKSEEIIK